MYSYQWLFYSAGIDTLVMSRGMAHVLQVPQSTVQYVKGQGVQPVVLQTEAAVEEYNRLVKAGRKVGGIFHSTC